RVFGGGHDVRGRRVHHEHTALGRGGYLHIVQSDTRPGDHLEPVRRGQHLGVDLGGGADQQRVGLLDGFEQRGTVGAVHVPYLYLVTEHAQHGGRELFGDEDDG